MNKKLGHSCGSAQEKAAHDRQANFLPDTATETPSGQPLVHLIERIRLATKTPSGQPPPHLIERIRLNYERRLESAARALAEGRPSPIFCCPMPVSPKYPEERQRPCFRCYDAPYIIGNSQHRAGVYHHVMEEKKDDAGNKIEVPVDRWILSVLRIISILRTESGGEHSYLIEFVPHGKTQPRHIVLPQSSLLAGGAEGMKILRDAGADVFGNNVKLILEYLDSEHHRFSAQYPDDFLVLAKVVGWPPVGERFVLPGQVIGAPGGVWFNGDNAVRYHTGGRFEDWKTQIAALCVNNFYLQLALSCAFAGPLLEPLNITGLGFHYFGDSTLGKSTALAIGASAWGRGEPPFMLSWSNTINGLESQAVCRSSTFFPIDESHQVDPKVLGKAVYMLLNGIGKGRMNKDISAREPGSWRCAVLSSGERSIETHQAAAKIDHKVGQAVRMIDIPVIKSQYGLFSDIHEAKNGAEFSDALLAAASRNCGHAGTQFITELINHYQGLNLPARLDGALQNFENIDGPLGAQDRRVARSFALAALAGELAIEWGILPWKKDSALIAAMEIFHHWKQTQPQSIGSKETQQILKAVYDFIQTYGACFSDIDWTPKYDTFNPNRIINTEPVVHERAGYWKELNGKRLYLFTSAGLNRASGGFGTRKAAEVLDEVDALIEKGADKKRSKSTTTPDGSKIRLYWVDPEKLEENL